VLFLCQGLGREEGEASSHEGTELVGVLAGTDGEGSGFMRSLVFTTTTRFGTTVPKLLPPDRHHKPCAKARGKPIAGEPHGGFAVPEVGNVVWLKSCDTPGTKGRGNWAYKAQPKPARQSSTLPERGCGRPAVERSHGARSALY
jgi:hypothetical protein